MVNFDVAQDTKKNSHLIDTKVLKTVQGIELRHLYKPNNS